MNKNIAVLVLVMTGGWLGGMIAKGMVGGFAILLLAMMMVAAGILFERENGK